MKVVCTICTDHIQRDLCAAPCGHTFHFECLSQWLNHQKTCPQCRERCLPRNVIKLYTDTSGDLSQVHHSSLSPQELQEKLSLQSSLMACKDQALVEAKASLDSIQAEMKAWQAQHKDMHKKLKSEQASSEVLRRQLTSVHTELDGARERRKELAEVRGRLDTLEGVEKVLKGSRDEVDTLVASHKSMSTLAMFVIALKRDYEVLRGKRAALLSDRGKQSGELNRAKKELLSREKELQTCQDQVSVLEIDLNSAEEEKRVLQKKVEMLHSAIDSPGSRDTLKRILESPMPDYSAERRMDLGASPLLAGSRYVPTHPSAPTYDDLLNKLPPIFGTKRPSAFRENYKENIVMPVNKKFKCVEASSLKPFSSHVLKNGLKFAPRKNSSSRLKNTRLHS